jgi:hypothetical protein
LKEPKWQWYWLKRFKRKHESFTHNSVSQNNRQLQHFSTCSGSVRLKPPLRFLRDFVDVTTRVNCIKLIDQAAKIRCIIVKLRWTPCSLNASNNSIISAV